MQSRRFTGQVAIVFAYKVVFIFSECYCVEKICYFILALSAPAVMLKLICRIVLARQVFLKIALLQCALLLKYKIKIIQLTMLLKKNSRQHSNTLKITSYKRHADRKTLLKWSRVHIKLTQAHTYAHAHTHKLPPTHLALYK